MPATVVIIGDQLLRGIADPAWWRMLEHAGWILFEDVVLFSVCVVGVREMHEVALRRAEAETSQDALVVSEKLAAVGQLAASVGHELRNPLAAVRTAATYVSKRLKDQTIDPKIPQFLGVIDRELEACSKIIADLLDFARERPPEMAPCPLRHLIDEAIALVPNHARVELVNDIPDDFPIPWLDKDQFRQIVVNLVQNAVEAIPADTNGRVVVTGVRTGNAIRVSVVDNGPGIPKQTLDRIFEPLFTTKTKGTGLGLAIVHNVLRRHHAEITVDSEIGRGTTFHIDLAATTPASKAA